MIPHTEHSLPHDPPDSFDRVLCKELFWEASPELTHCLLALATQAAVPEGLLSRGQVPMAPLRPRLWYTTLVTVLTALAVSLSLAVAWQMYGMIGAELGLPDMWLALQSFAAGELARLYSELPMMRSLIALVGSVRDQLHWILIAIVLWLALDGWSPRVTLQQASG